jgi:hypothetical protein
MKTTRYNCFETNSSSTHSITTHSITIESNSNAISADFPSLAQDNILYPARINDENIRAAFYTAKRGEWTFKANTKSSKAALFVHYIYSILDSEELDEEQLADVMCSLASYMGYDSINLGPDSFFSHYTIAMYDGEAEYSPEIDKMLEYIGRSIQGNKFLIDMQKLGLHIQSIVNDDTKTLIDFSEEH